MKKLFSLLALVLSVAGFVPGHATVVRTVVMAATYFFCLYLPNAGELSAAAATSFFLVSTAAYIGFIYLVLPENGLRHWFIQAFGGEEEGYLAYEAVLGFLFVLNGAGIGCISLAFPHSFPLPIEEEIVRPFAAILFVTGWQIKIWSAKVVGVDIYYWKDMFCGRKISPFVAEGPYKYMSNPMYGMGQLQTYATALWYLSLPGLVAALVNQLLVFSFYHFQEKALSNERILKDRKYRAAVSYSRKKGQGTLAYRFQKKRIKSFGYKRILVANEMLSASFLSNRTVKYKKYILPFTQKILRLCNS